MGPRASTLIGISSVVVLLGLTLAAVTVSLLKELEAKRRRLATRQPA